MFEKDTGDQENMWAELATSHLDLANRILPSHWDPVPQELPILFTPKCLVFSVAQT